MQSNMDEGSDSKPEKKEDELNVLKEEEEGGCTLYVVEQ